MEQANVKQTNRGDQSISEPQADNLRAPVLAIFKDQCRSVLLFLRGAHERQVENAKRLGVSADDLAQYASGQTPIQRERAIDTIRHTLRSVNEGHSGSFPDYLGAARRLKDFYKGVMQGRADCEAADTADPRSPAAVARIHAEMLFATLGDSNNQVQRGQCILLLNSLINRTAQSLPSVSSELKQKFDRKLETGFSAPAWATR